MKKLRYLIPIVAMLAQSTNAQLPPLIDREIFFDDPRISGAQISPDGKFITFVKPFNNVRNIWIKERTEPFESARPITADTKRPVEVYFWSHDSKYILYAQDKGGDENYRIYAVDPYAVGDPVPTARDLTPIENVRAMIISVPRSTPQEILIGLNNRRADLHDVFRLNLSTGERTLVRENNENIAGWTADLNGDLRLATRINQAGGTEILNINGENLDLLYEVNSDESCAPLRFTPDGKRFYLVTNKGDKLDKTQLELFDLTTRKTTFVDKDPKNEVDFGGALFSDVTNELLATVYVGDRLRIYPRQKEFEKTWNQLKKTLPNGEISIVSQTADEKIWLVSVSRDVDPSSVYLYDVRTNKSELLYRSRPDLPTEHLAPMKPVRYRSRDALEIPAYLTLPKGIPSKNLPVVMVIHGGPWARDIWGYNAVAQFLANRGYAVFQPNFRGSAGYGKKFLNAGNKQWGTGAMQHDITDGVQYLIKEGIADPKRVAIFGASYGGYAALAGLCFTPDLYAAGVSMVGPSSIITLLNSIPPYWAPIKKIFSVRVGDMDKPEEREMLEKQSPLNFAKNIKAPLLVAQGANDPRVKKSESDQIVVAMRDLGRTVEYIVAPDEGHGFLGRENRLAFFTAMEKFLANHIKGRYQESVSEDIKKKLDEITVDVNTVTMPPPPTIMESTGEMPNFDGNKLKPFTAKYLSKMSVMEREITLTTNRKVAKAEVEGRNVWRIIEDTNSPMGSGHDTLDVDARTLLPLKQVAYQGAAYMTLTFKPDAVEGKISGAMEMPISIKIDSPTITVGAGMEIAISTLPLTTGYVASLKTIDIVGGKTKSVNMKVVGTETVTTAAGSFDAFIVEIYSADGEGETKLWIAKNDGRVVKKQSKLPAHMGGGTVIGEIVE